MQTLAERRRSGREAQARYAARQRESGVPSRLQVLTAVEAGVQAAVAKTLAMEDGVEKRACVLLLETLLKGSLVHLDGLTDLDKKASRAALTKILLDASASG